MKCNAVVSLVGLLALPTLVEPIGSTNQAAAQESREFDLVVVDSEQQPVPGAVIEVRGRPILDGSWVVRGRFDRLGNYGSTVTAGQQGRLVLEIPDKASPSFFIKHPGFAYYHAEWRNEPRPDRFQAVLMRAIEVGGIVQDVDGRPIGGATVSPFLYYQNRPGDSSHLGIGVEATTDDEGRWTYQHVPEDVTSFSLEINHPRFKSHRQKIARDMFVLSGNKLPGGVLVMERGLTVMGTVVDEEGQPVVGALVRTKYANDIRRAETDQRGKYELTGCEPVASRIVVSAPGKAVDLKEVQVDASMPSVDFVMKQGGQIRIRVLDEQGQPIPKARIFFQRWRTDRYDYFELDHVNQYANEQGVWEWNEAPLDEFYADICRPGGMQLGKERLIARSDEYVFLPPPALVVLGQVVDAETQQPIEKFRVVPGVRGAPDRMNWVPYETFEARDGSFEYRRVHDYFGHLFKVEADGYLPVESRDIKSNEGRVTVKFEMQRGAGIDIRVMTPVEKPAVGARVALGIPGAQINVHNGDIDDGSTYAQQETVNEVGRLRFPAQGGAFQLVITHPSGYAHVKSETAEQLRTVQLTAWAKAEGVFRVAGEPVPGVTISLHSGNVRSYGDDVPNIFTHNETVTDAQGRYSFDRVFPGSGGVQRYILRMVDEGAKEVTSSTNLTAEFVAGETSVINFGDRGTSVSGRLLAPDNDSKEPVPPAFWSFADVRLQPKPDLRPMPIPDNLQDQAFERQAWIAQWRATDEGKAWLEEFKQARLVIKGLPTYTATVGRDGRFKFDDVITGQYSLSVRSWEKRELGQIVDYPVSVSAEQEAEREEVDLGNLQMVLNLP